MHTIKIIEIHLFFFFFNDKKSTLLQTVGTGTWLLEPDWCFSVKHLWLQYSFLKVLVGSSGVGSVYWEWGAAKETAQLAASKELLS